MLHTHPSPPPMWTCEYKIFFCVPIVAHLSIAFTYLKLFILCDCLPSTISVSKVHYLVIKLVLLFWYLFVKRDQRYLIRYSLPHNPAVGRWEDKKMLLVPSVLWLFFLTNLVLSIPQPHIRSTEDEFIQILEAYEASASEKCRVYNLAAWNYMTDVENDTKVDELVSKHRMS